METSNIISIVALAVSCGSLWYSYEQTEISKANYYSAVEQLHIAKAAQKISESSYSLTLEQWKMQKNEQARNNFYQVIPTSETDSNFEREIGNGEIINISLVNESKESVPYVVEIKSEGMGLFWPNGQPDKMYYYLKMDKRPALIRSTGNYKTSFSVWISETPAETALISIIINGRVIRSYKYIYSFKKKKYSYISENG